MKLTKIFLLLILTLLFIGLSYATEVSNETTNTMDTSITETNDEVVQSSNTPIKEADNNIIDEINTKISKQYNKSVKTESKTIDINDFKTLHNTLTSDTYDTLTLNIKSNIKLTDNIKLNTAIKNLTINGNGKTIQGQYSYQFLEINSGNKVTIQNIDIIKCVSDYGGAICNYYGKLTIKNSTFQQNNAEYGGVLYNAWGTIIIENTTLHLNTASATNYYSGVVNGCAGAIYNTGEGKITIKNSIFKNNYAINGGVIYNRYANLIISNSSFNNNKASGYDNGDYDDYLPGFGGAIYNSRFSNLTITDNSFYNNIAEQKGGAIYNELAGNVTIINSTLNNNKVENLYGENDCGGAIFNDQGSYVTIIDNTLNYNKATEGGATYNNGLLTIVSTELNNNIGQGDLHEDAGGAIYNSETLSISNSSLNNNRADYGGAIYNGRGTLTITNSTLNNNTAYLFGGAIYNNGFNLTITNNVLNNNTAIEGSAIYNRDTASIKNNTFKTNKASIAGKVIINTGTAIILDNIDDDISLDNCTIYTEGTNVNITNNVFDDGRINTKITVNKIANTQYTDNATIKGRLKTSTGALLNSITLTVSINGKKVGTTKTDAIGTFTYNYKTNTPGTNNITITYAGNSKYTPTTTKTIFNVTQKTTKITINKITSTQYTDNATITGTFQSTSGKVLPATLTITINGKKYTTKSDTNGTFTLKYKTTAVGTNNITATYAGNALYKTTTTKTTFKVVKQNLKIILNKTKTTGYGSKVTIKGTFMDATGKILGNSIIRINLNGKTYKVKANSKGIFTKSIKTNKLGTNNITVNYPGNKNYNQISIKKTFKVVKNNVTVSITSLKQVGKTRNITITGKFTDKNGNILKNSKITIKINNKTYTTKTNNKGIYTLTKAAKKGSNTITVGYAGNKNYNKYTSTPRKITIN